jgi:(E)-4-hydroxy-3-methylbut-2-enyl-diphosphate synthase
MTLDGSTCDVTAMLLEWASLGYLALSRSRQGVVLLTRTMEMGSERSAAEQRLFYSIFGNKLRVAATPGRFSRAAAQFRAASRRSLYRVIFDRSGGNPVLIQSMTNTRTEDVRATVEQIHRLEEAGCEIIRCTVPNIEAARAIAQIKKEIRIPLVADIHFDYKMAIAAIENGADKIRINPGNIGGKDRIDEVVRCAKERQIPIRVGVNSGSLERELVAKYNGVTAEGLVESALDKVRMVEECGYEQIVISIKSSDVMMCIRAHEILAQKCNYPLHVGITEAGTLMSGNIKSAIGLGVILYQGIGDTIRVSLTGDPVEEIKSGKQILRTLGLRKGGIDVVSCPTCGRTKIDLIGLANRVETLVQGYPLNIKVAVMGCAVNGPGEAREADLGIAGGDGEGLLIKRGKIIRKMPESELLDALKQELDSML